MVLPLSQETRKSQKSSPHPLFSSGMMYHLWLVSSSDITNEVTAHAPLVQKPFWSHSSFDLSRSLTLLAIPFIPQMLSVFYVYPWSMKKQIYFFQSSPLLDPQLISSLLPGLLFHDLETQHFSLEERRNSERRTGQGS